MYVHRLLVERVFAQYMVPHNLETAERMKCLYYLYATLDTNAVKYVLICIMYSDSRICWPVSIRTDPVLYLAPLRALNEMWKCQNLLRQHVKDLLELIKKPKVTHWNRAEMARRCLEFLMFLFCFICSLKHLARPSLLRSWWSQVRDFILIRQQSKNKNRLV